jgi:hypothetical protein
VIARHRFELRDVERREDFAQFKHARTAGLAAGTGRGVDGIAGVEQNGAAVLHVRVDALERILGRSRHARHDRPVDQRIKGKLVMGDVEPDRIAGFERSALGEKQREPGKASLADRVDVAVAGHDIGKPGLQRRRRHGGFCRILRVSRRYHQREERKAGHGRCGSARAPRQQSLNTAAEKQDDDGIEQD